MLKKLLACVGEYKKYTILTPVVMIGEVLMEVLIPLVMAKIVDVGIANGDVAFTVKMGLIMVSMAIFSLCCGALGGKFAAKAGMGFAKNVRKKLFDKVQDFSFANVDKFSTASLVTRLTTDVTNVQNTFMMIIRMAVRAPFMLIVALIMSISLNAELAVVFLVAIPVLGVAVGLITTKAFPRFEKMLEKYDSLNSKVQENLIGIRVVKAFVRERFEGKKFVASADDVRAAQVNAEKLVILGQPAMQIIMYACIVAVIYFGGNMVIGGTFLVGELSSFISYVTQILMSLMMLSMIFVMTTISLASMHRIVEIFDEVPEIRDDDADPAADGAGDGCAVATGTSCAGWFTAASGESHTSVPSSRACFWMRVRSSTPRTTLRMAAIPVMVAANTSARQTRYSPFAFKNAVHLPPSFACRTAKTSGAKPAARNF